MKRLVFVFLAMFSFSLFAQGENHLQQIVAERKIVYEQKSAEEKAALRQEINEFQKAETAYRQNAAEQSLWITAGYLMALIGEIASSGAE